MAHRHEDLVAAREFIAIHGAGALQGAQQRADLATVAKDPFELVHWSGVADAIAELLEGGDCC